jgi:periplasmic protein CpxP/Spy
MIASAKTLSAAVVAAFCLAAPALAQAPDGAAGGQPPAAAQQPAQPMHQGHRQGHAQRDSLEARIADLHGKLKITPEQEPEWQAVAQVMRDNAKATGEQVEKSRQNEATMTAVDDLRAYAQIASTHAQGVNRLADEFGKLYASMSDDQKKTADQVFRHHRREHVHHRT